MYPRLQPTPLKDRPDLFRDRAHYVTFPNSFFSGLNRLYRAMDLLSHPGTKVFPVLPIRTKDADLLDVAYSNYFPILLYHSSITRNFRVPLSPQCSQHLIFAFCHFECCDRVFHMLTLLNTRQLFMFSEQNLPMKCIFNFILHCLPCFFNWCIPVTC